jgi:hydroxypyruvate isomerase
VDHKGYYLDGTATGFDIVRAVDSPNVKLLYDVYHMQIMEGNIIATVTENIDCIGHFHAAGVPGRHELWSGELDYRRITEAIDKAGYTGSFGLEYWPTGDHAASLAQTARYLGLS